MSRWIQVQYSLSAIAGDRMEVAVSERAAFACRLCPVDNPDRHNFDKIVTID